MKPKHISWGILCKEILEKYLYFGMFVSKLTKKTQINTLSLQKLAGFGQRKSSHFQYNFCSQIPSSLELMVWTIMVLRASYTVAVWVPLVPSWLSWFEEPQWCNHQYPYAINFWPMADETCSCWVKGKCALAAITLSDQEYLCCSMQCWYGTGIAIHISQVMDYLFFAYRLVCVVHSISLKSIACPAVPACLVLTSVLRNGGAQKIAPSHEQLILCRRKHEARCNGSKYERGTQQGTDILNKDLESPGTSKEKIYGWATEGPSIQVNQFQNPPFSQIHWYGLSLSVELNCHSIQNRMVTSKLSVWKSPWPAPKLWHWLG